MNNTPSISTERTLAAHASTAAAAGRQSPLGQISRASNAPVEPAAARISAWLNTSDPECDHVFPGTAAAVQRIEDEMELRQDATRLRTRQLFERRKAEMAELAQEVTTMWEKRSSRSAPAVAPKPRKAVASEDKAQPVAGPSRGGANAVQDEAPPVPRPRSLFPQSPQKPGFEESIMVEKIADIDEGQAIQPCPDSILQNADYDHLHTFLEIQYSLLTEFSDGLLDIEKFRKECEINNDQKLYSKFGEFTDAIEKLAKARKSNNLEGMLIALREFMEASVDLRYFFYIILRQLRILLMFKH